MPSLLFFSKFLPIILFVNAIVMDSFYIFHKINVLISRYNKGFWWGNMRERDDLEDPRVDGRTILRWIIRKWDGDADWIDSIEDRDRW
jgi:hypothetical protein